MEIPTKKYELADKQRKATLLLCFEMLNNFLTPSCSPEQVEQFNKLKEYLFAIYEITDYTIIKKDEIINLLNDFWQSKSDMCPLECSEMENQLNEFKQYITKKYFTNK